MPNAVVSDPVANPQEQAPLFSTAKLLEEWRATCRTFLSWEKERILLGKPTAEERDKHRRTLTWLLRMTRLLDGLLSDPEFPDRSAAGRLKPLLFLLDASWKTIYNPLPEQEYGRIIAQCFPANEPGTTGAH